jgi:hypothetical protein
MNLGGNYGRTGRKAKKFGPRPQTLHVELVIIGAEGVIKQYFELIPQDSIGEMAIGELIIVLAHFYL